MKKEKIRKIETDDLSTEAYHKYKKRVAKSKSENIHYVWQLDNYFIDDNNHIEDILIDEDDIIEKDKYELDINEKQQYLKLKKDIHKYEEALEKAEDQLKHFEARILSQINNEQIIYDGESWDCSLSPFGKCMYHLDQDGECTCIFCGEPEERK